MCVLKSEKSRPTIKSGLLPWSLVHYFIYYILSFSSVCHFQNTACRLAPFVFVPVESSNEPPPQNLWGTPGGWDATEQTSISRDAAAHCRGQVSTPGRAGVGTTIRNGRVCLAHRRLLSLHPLSLDLVYSTAWPSYLLAIPISIMESIAPVPSVTYSHTHWH